MSFTQALTGTRIVNLMQGDSIERVAMRELGDAALWLDLVSINDLVAPYITDDPTAATVGVVYSVGGTLIVPAAPPAASGVSTDDIYGTDILLQGGRLVVDDTGDFAVVSGADNLTQALENRIASYTGDLVFYPTYGCDLYTLQGQGLVSSDAELAAVFIARACGADPRISSVANAVGTISGDQVLATCDAIAVNGKQIPTNSAGGTNAVPN